MRKEYKVIRIQGTSALAIEDGLNDASEPGWEFVQLLQLGAIVYAVFARVVSY